MAEFIPANTDCVRDVADKGTEGIAGLEEASFGARGPSANFKSGGTTSFGVPRFSAATGIAEEPCDREDGWDLTCVCGLVFGGLLRAEGNTFEGE